MNRNQYLHWSRKSSERTQKQWLWLQTCWTHWKPWQERYRHLMQDLWHCLQDKILRKHCQRKQARIKMILLKICVNKVHWQRKKPWEYDRKYRRCWVRKHCISTFRYSRNHEERTSTNNCMPGQVNQVFYLFMSQKAAAKRFLCIFHPDVLYFSW